ncbi:unnamed protein product [Paramecium primaurelia]|uniref:Uncharacterized protein n=1 Tax=Paramecium primaurelia TaxID=5886 RepID=A0A8S1K2I0_PARPR|nr:unnamed protein product [Paramecium primaurelia]
MNKMEKQYGQQMIKLLYLIFLLSVIAQKVDLNQLLQLLNVDNYQLIVYLKRLLNQFHMNLLLQLYLLLQNMDVLDIVKKMQSKNLDMTKLLFIINHQNAITLRCIQVKIVLQN